MTTDLLAVFISDLSHRGAVGSKPVCDNYLGSAVPLHSFLQEPKRSGFIPGLGDIACQYFTFVIDGAPEIVLDPIYLYEDLI